MRKKKLNKFFIASAATVVAASGVAAPSPANANSTFPDVKTSDYFYNAVMELSERGVINGFEDGTFRPNNNVTRGQAAVIFAGVLGLNTNNVTNPGFKDVPTSHPYYGAISALANAGYINGFEDGTFGATQPITRNQMAIIIAKAFKLEAPANTTLPFTDVYPAYKNQIAALFTNGITSGTSKTTFGGSANVTRGQLAQFVVKAENVSKSEDVENSTTFTIESISDSKIQTSQGELAVNSSLQSIFKSSNAAALKNAEVKAVVSNGEVKSISSITLNATGTANTPVVFDGSQATISGDVKVNADYVALNNVTVNGDLTLTAKVVNKFAGKGLVTNGELIVENAPASPVASINGVVAAETKGPEVELLESTIKSILAERNGVKISSDSKLPELKISAEVTNIEVNANVAKVTVNVTLKIEITGKGTLDQVTIEKAEEIALQVAGIVKELVVANQTTKVEVGVNVEIDKLVVPEGKKVDEVIKNFNQVRNNIKEVKDAKGATVNKPSTGGGSGGGSNNGGGNNNKNFSLSIMHTNDTHASLDNAPKTVTAVKEVRAEKPDALLLNAGDVFSGTLYFNEFQGQADLKMMNLMGYDAMTFGNHEFDLGSSEDGHQGLVDFIKGANFPFVSSNVNFTADEKFTGLFSDLISSEPENGKIYNGIIKEINGEKVGIFGLTTAETKDLSSPGAITFEDYKVEAEKAVKAFEDKGVDKIIAITHIGYDDNAAIDNDLTLAKEVEGIDVIVGGHSHTTLKEPVVVKEDATPTVIVQAGANNSNLGLLDVEFDKNGVVVGQAGKLIAIGDQVEDTEAKKILTPYKEKVQELAEQPIGVTADVALLNPRVGDEGNTTGESVRKNETILGNLITDGMLAKAKETTGKNVIMAFQNGGGIRSSIDAGPITVGEVITVLPFGNTLAVMDVTGAELKEAFEISLGKLPGENGGFLHVAGAKVEFDSSKPSGERVISLQYQDTTGNYIDILDSETYTVATNAFTAQGGDGYTPFAKAYAEGRVTDLGLSDWQNFAEHLQSLDSIPTQIEGRIVDVAGAVDNFSLSIMHTNDTHASLDNMPKTVTAVKDVRAEKPDALLLNAGDVFSGTLYFNEFQGKADLEFMNLMKYDAMTFGNHEFDLGSSPEGHQALADFIAGAHFPFVSANVNFAADEKFQGLFSDTISSEPEKGKIYNGIVKEINGEKVGIFGLTTAETKALSSPGAITFEDYKAEAQKAVKAFEALGINKIVAITHIGYDDNAAVDNDLTLAKEVEGIDVIVGGHSHTTLVEPVVVKEDATPTVIVQSGSSNSNLGVLDVKFNDNGVVVDVDGELIKIGDQVEDEEAKAILAPYKNQVSEVAEKEIGVSTQITLENPRTNGDNTKPSVRKNETILGNLITDGMLAKAKEFTGENVIMALQNGGGIRAEINQGPITVGEVITVLPFGNTLAVMDVTGAEIKEAFEVSLSKLPGENGGFLHVSGAKVEYDSTKPVGQRVVSVKYKDVNGNFIEILNTERYTIATNAFTAQGGDGYDVFAKAYAEGRVTDLGLSDWENFAEHLRKLTTIPTQTEGRIVDVAGQVIDPVIEISPEDFSGTETEPKVYEGDVKVKVGNTTLLQNAVIIGDLILEGTASETFNIKNVTVEGNADLSSLEATNYTFDGLQVTGDTKL